MLFWSYVLISSHFWLEFQEGETIFSSLIRRRLNTDGLQDKHFRSHLACYNMYSSFQLLPEYSYSWALDINRPWFPFSQNQNQAERISRTQQFNPKLYLLCFLLLSEIIVPREIFRENDKCNHTYTSLKTANENWGAFLHIQNLALVYFLPNWKQLLSAEKHSNVHLSPVMVKWFVSFGKMCMVLHWTP